MRNAHYTVTVAIDRCDRRPRSQADALGVEVTSPTDRIGGRHALHRSRCRDEALLQIQHIAYDGGLLGGQAEADRGIDGAAADAVRALTAKLERICNIAEACEPDEDWRPPGGEQPVSSV